MVKIFWTLTLHKWSYHLILVIFLIVMAKATYIRKSLFGLSVKRKVIHHYYREVMKKRMTDHMVSVVRKWSGLQWSYLSNHKTHPCDCALQQGSTPKGSTASRDSIASWGEEFRCLSLWGAFPLQTAAHFYPTLSRDAHSRGSRYFTLSAAST